MPTEPNMNQTPAEERLSEVAEILATGLLRLRFRTRVAGGNSVRNNLESGRNNSPHMVTSLKKGETT
jgi:hypothetical protein